MLRSVKDAYSGIKHVYIHEQNFRIQIFVSFIIVIIMLLLHLTRGEMVVVLLLILLVLVLELLNTAIEKFLDIVKPRMHLHVAVVKDIMASMVLLASIFALFIGIIIFLPYIVDLFIL
ncbi:MAG: hypothetical protein A2725_01435 [Candidatus Magasanikbacteria bacterium RIFCSPHIGHO2_01_FULL_33_34]|uniref:Diacylglycerol kinase n=1 Tax=Candidatus Magasanikbacteria bacterium RIFCSPHIGHO2_01_FULL_33_34 TaxID=1798671 RepID=A0A1F6LJG7_9BACT|nr:MAG: hypothetical protein A2725_01435 [Candidatus Magasanikbacteria bacterium RIFCSPHIGHO2_01_FULL_33_34]OGH65584.1 MAG: hypothetical protein A3B83_01190 [Candidatus Magasanikbacteria bacterium RIFCSPHIGHO2_02_FULL_33_17]OGH76304.1 MAG: hypothetical protein A3A89_02010 [Candidatus Magasanikbacteria bacterium RIFCSPLOWO2_01_FULL_33_34]OGH81948.1 MAG: hypothetical protein A3F93_01235 [Candidatus Magasanikbacteria bacterium RIFCSPLOWO2_12_FULL_34_7]